MKKTLIAFLLCLAATTAFAGNILVEGFEYGNHDLETPIGWTTDNNAWACGYLEKDGNRLPHSGNWYAFSNADDAWMYMPMYMFQNMQYRFTLWAISDGDFQLEIWGGPEATANAMTLLSTAAITGDEYQKVSAYVTSVPANCQYFALRAVRGDRGSYLTVDDIELDMVEQYSFDAEAITGDTTLVPGTQGSFRFRVENTGYDALDVSAHPSNEFFTGFSCYCNGASGMTFHVEPTEVVEVTITATLRPEITPGTVSWLDVQMTIPCNCNTAMVTFWVTPVEVTSVAENDVQIDVFPNPAADHITIKADALQGVEIIDLSGRVVMTQTCNGNHTTIDLSPLQKGLYVVSVKTIKGFTKQSIVKR